MFGVLCLAGSHFKNNTPKSSGKGQPEKIYFTKSEFVLIVMGLWSRLSFYYLKKAIHKKTCAAEYEIPDDDYEKTRRFNYDDQFDRMRCDLPSDVSQIESDAPKKATAENKPDNSDPKNPLKSPHGYVITKDYELGSFGGFIGDCTDDKNWPYYWQCMSENAGNGGFK